MLEIGNSLQEARRRRGVSLTDAEAATKIRCRYLEALEHERFELMPVGPYARSFLREYAEFLGLDGDILATEYDLRFFVPPEEPPEPPSTRRELAGLLSEIPVATPLLGLGVIAIVAFGVWRLGQSPARRVHSGPSSQLVAQKQKPKPAVKTTPPPVHPAHAPAHPAFALTAARGACWLSVHLGSGAGATVYEGTLQPGQTVRFGLGRPLWVRVGAPWNLHAAIGERNVDASLPSLTGDVLVSAGGVHAAA